MTIPAPGSDEYAGGVVTFAQRSAYYESSFAVGSDGRRLRTMKQEYMSKLPLGDASGDAFRVFIYGNTNYSLIQDHVNYLYWRGWLDAQSKELEIKALLLNAEVGRPRLEQVKIVFAFSRGGGIFAMMSLESLFLRSWAGPLSQGCDLFWVMMLFAMTANELYKAVHESTKGRLCRHLHKLGTLLEWCIIVLGYVVILGYWYQDTMRVTIVSSLQEATRAQMEDVPADLNTLGVDFHNNADSMVVFLTWFRILVADYHLLLMFRFFTSFHAQPRLSIVTRTLESSFIDIMHFCIVLLPTFLAFAVAGMFIFGRRLAEFSTIQGAMGSCFKMLMEGEYDWQRLSEEHYWTTLAWTWTFVLLLVLLMLNMVLVIVMDVYQLMRNKAKNCETLWQTIKRMLQHLWHLKSWIKTDQMLSYLRHAQRYLNREDLQQAFPTMCDAQLDGLMAACFVDDEFKGKGALNWTATSKTMVTTRYTVDSIVTALHRLATKGEEPDEATSYFKPPEKDQGWLDELARKMAVQNHLLLSLQWMMQQLRWQWEGMDAMSGPDGRLRTPRPSYDKDGKSFSEQVVI